MATLCRVRLLCSNNRAQRAGKICLHKNVANLRHFTVWKKDAFGVSPLRKDRCARLNVLHAQFINGKTVGEFNCRLHDLGE